ncbi:hypothetical protein SBRCBS47491_001687 [Sporothrix bragantina]|uniref:Uncharacterized protein n=1 Tax=Sporothrix bragantina TaxID=671064 RepID=A0ABP0B0Q6_9PEZI
MFPDRKSVVTIGMVLSTLAVAETVSTATSTSTTYPTTITSIWTTTITSSASPSDIWTTARTVTVLEPWSVSPDPYGNFPYTIHQTSIIRETVAHAATTVTPAASTAYPTWVLWDTQAADLPVGNVPRCESVASSNGVTKGCAPSALKPDTRCLDLGLETRCHAQCIIRDWQWWCRQADDGLLVSNSSDSSELPMGRLCWGNSHNYTQLVEPCDGTDYPPDCDACPSADAQ